MKRRISAMIRLRSDQRIAHVGIDDQIDVALAIAFLDVRQAVPLVRQWHQRFTDHVKW